MSIIRKLPIGVQDFEKLRTGGNVYIDKTSYIYQLTSTDAPYFLARPRRFGKSLFLSTLKAYFLGKKELFEGLAIAEFEKDWLEYPVFYLDFNVEAYISVDSLYSALNANLSYLEEKWGKNPEHDTPSTRFSGLIRRAYEKTGRKVVVLIDEYDKPLLNTMNNAEVNNEIRSVLKGFYGVLKGSDEYLRFVFLTGVTKFSKVSIFSDLNHLKDISMAKSFSGICGISETELVNCFEPEINNLADDTGKSYDDTLAKLKKHYDGYRFAKESEDMYNPFSLLNTFASLDFSNYWYATGTPTFLVNMLKEGDFDIPTLDNDIHISANEVSEYRAEWHNPVPLLYQSGYLTIKDYDSEYDEYCLGFPNEEVKYGFLNDLLPAFVPYWKSNRNFSAASFTRALRSGDIETFMTNMRAFYGSISYDMTENKDERYYQFVFYLIIKLMGQFVQTEVKSAIGRADAVIKTSDRIYILEFKMAGAGTAEDALKQIDDRGYLIPYSTDGRQLVKVGAEFDGEKRTIGRWVVEAP